jgi:hypothetical protein
MALSQAVGKLNIPQQRLLRRIESMVAALAHCSPLLATAAAAQRQGARALFGLSFGGCMVGYEWCTVP